MSGIVRVVGYGKLRIKSSHNPSGVSWRTCLVVECSCGNPARPIIIGSPKATRFCMCPPIEHTHNGVTVRLCCRCKRWLFLERFSAHPSGKRGLKRYCKECRNDVASPQALARRRANREEYNRGRRERYARLEKKTVRQWWYPEVGNARYQGQIIPRVKVCPACSNCPGRGVCKTCGCEYHEHRGI